MATCASIGFRLPIAPGSECACWSSIERTEKVMSLGVYAPWAPRIRSTNALPDQVSPTGARVPRASRGRQRRLRTWAAVGTTVAIAPAVPVCARLSAKIPY